MIVWLTYFLVQLLYMTRLDASDKLVFMFASCFELALELAMIAFATVMYFKEIVAWVKSTAGMITDRPKDANNK